jgi:hypothetical protein
MRGIILLPRSSCCLLGFLLLLSGLGVLGVWAEADLADECRAFFHGELV